MDLQELMLTALRATAVYFFVLVVIRLLGKRSVGNLSAFDLLVALMLGEMVDEIIYGDVDMLKGFVAIGMVALWHLVNAWSSYKSTAIERLTSGEPRLLVEHGQIKRDALAAERLNEEELWSNLRMQGIDDLGEVKTATLEPSGHISVIQEEWAKPIEKRDLEVEQRNLEPAGSGQR